MGFNSVAGGAGRGILASEPYMEARQKAAGEERLRPMLELLMRHNVQWAPIRDQMRLAAELGQSPWEQMGGRVPDDAQTSSPASPLTEMPQSMSDAGTGGLYAPGAQTAMTADELAQSQAASAGQDYLGNLLRARQGVRQIRPLLRQLRGGSISKTKFDTQEQGYNEGAMKARASGDPEMEAWFAQRLLETKMARDRLNAVTVGRRNEAKRLLRLPAGPAGDQALDAHIQNIGSAEAFSEE